jgi:hypothetical protein
MPIWNMRALSEHLLRQRGEPMAREALRSIGQVDVLFRYYKRAALAAIDRAPSFGDGKASTENTALAFTMIATGEEELLAIEANTVGAVHMIRSAYDYIAHIVNCLVLDASARLKPKRVYAEEVFKLVPSSPLADILSEIRATNAYVYIVSYNNTVKHRQHIGFGPWVNFSTDEAGIGPTAFDDDKHVEGKFPQRTARQVLQDCVDLWNGLVLAGSALNGALQVDETS